MNRRRVGVAAAVLLALLVAAGPGGASVNSHARASATTVTVWLQVDAQQNWPDVVNAATQTFEQQHPGVTVDVQYQQWSDHLTKLDASIAGNNAPDVVEMGNSETVKYMAAGAFADLSSQKSSFPNSSTWLKGLADSCKYQGKLFCVPYYAGARAVIYRKDLYHKVGIKKAPTTLAQFTTDSDKLMAKYGSNPNFSALYFPGKYWYAAMSFVYDFGGQIATQSGGKWAGALDSPKAIQGLTALKAAVGPISRASKTGDEAHPFQALVFSKGKVGSIYANGWEWGLALDPKQGNPKLANDLGAFPMPSHVKGRYMPTFLGGSDLAIPVTSKNQALAQDWIRDYTSTQSETQMATVGKVIANTTTLAKINAGNPQLAPFAAAAKYSWFVPTAANWTNVENANVLQNMLVSIFTGKSTIAQATKSASKQITQILNASS